MGSKKFNKKNKKDSSSSSSSSSSTSSSEKSSDDTSSQSEPEKCNEKCANHQCKTKRLYKIIEVPITVRKVIWQKLKVPVDIQIQQPKCCSQENEQNSKDSEGQSKSKGK